MGRVDDGGRHVEGFESGAGTHQRILHEGIKVDIAIFLRVPLIMSADAQGHAFQYRRPFTRPQQRLCLFGGRKSGFDVVAVNILVPDTETRSEEHTSELQSLMRNSYAVFCLKKNTKNQK